MPFDPKKFIDEAVKAVKDQVGSGKVVLGASGGVDSTVAAAIGGRAIGKRLTAVFVDTGLLRKGESETAVKNLGALGLTLRHVDASTEFFEALKGVTDPEAKRKAIGERFVRVFEREAKKSGAAF